MISERQKKFYRLVIFLILVMLFAGIQTSLWASLFGFISPPMLWIFPVAYLTIYREQTEGLASVYVSAILLSSFSAIPVGIFVLAVLSLYGVGRFFRSRFFWKGVSYFALVATGMTVLFHGVHWLLSHLFENNPVVQPSLGRWLFEVMVAPLFAIFVFPLLGWLDQVLEVETSGEGAT